MGLNREFARMNADLNHRSTPVNTDFFTEGNKAN